MVPVFFTGALFSFVIDLTGLSKCRMLFSSLLREPTNEV